MQPRIVEVRQGILKKNDLLAAELRRRFREAGVFVVNLVSSPGAGKTALLERTLTALHPRLRVAALVGDLATERDAERLRSSGAPVRQITTGTVCHLDAEMVERALAGWDLAALDYLFIENVGNLVCPSRYDLGEDLRAVLLSVTEGEDKPLKYPTIFDTSDLSVITKIDLAGAAGFDRAAALANVQAARPGMAVLEVSAKSCAGMDAWLELLRTRQAEKTHRAAAGPLFQQREPKAGDAVEVPAVARHQGSGA
ncbi:MAG: hydrogenase nickel incorporation protein HypB [Thermoanaerobaculia bacterium]